MGDGVKVVLGGVVGALVALFLVGGLFRSGMGYGMMGGVGRMVGGSMMGGGLFGVLFSALFWILLLALLVAAAIWLFDRTQRR